MTPIITGCDYSFAKPDPHALVKARMGFVVRYVGGDGAKTIHGDEFTALSAAHIPLVLVHETSAQWMLGGYDAGVNGAQLARADMEAAGIPLTIPVYAAADFDVTAEQANQVMNAWSGFASQHGANRTGLYGGLLIAQYASPFTPFIFQTRAWSQNPDGQIQWEPDAVLRQISAGQIGGMQVDYNQAVSWNFGQYTPPAPPWPGRLFSYNPEAPEIHGTDVQAWQQRMADRGWPLSVDGWYGPQSAQVCQQFQKMFHDAPLPGLADDDIVGDDTWNAAFTLPITA